MSVATWGGAAASLVLLAGCATGGSSGQDDPSTPAPSSASSPSPSVDPSTAAAEAIRGDWEAPEAEWIVHFEEDGTFTEDYQGLKDFRVGTFEVDGDVVRLIGDDGNTDEGKLSGSGDDTALAFKLGTLKRQ